MYVGKKVDASHIEQYQRGLENEVLLRNAVASTISNDSDIDLLCSSISSSVLSCGDKHLPKSKFKRHLKPYWNNDLSESHKQMRTFRNKWVQHGRSRDTDNVIYKEYKTAKRMFRRLHRAVLSKYLQSLDDEIDGACELDKSHFWKLINTRRKPSNSQPGAELCFDGVMYRDQCLITEQWKLYFERLYSESENVNFNDNFREITESRVNTIIQNVTSDPNIEISESEVKFSLQKCKKGKAAGVDNVCYEHYIYAGDFIVSALARLYTSMLRLGYVPELMKKGVIITLFKGGNKRKDDPNNYRAITLTPTILKIFETILMNRCKDTIIKNLSIQQGGFQENLGCLMTSFLVKESLLYCKEFKSPVYACFLDARQAFDRVWHAGLFLKLSECGIDQTYLKIFIQMYDNMKSCVRNNGHVSEWFNVLQGTRQGGKSSPVLYLLYIDGLIKEL